MTSPAVGAGIVAFIEARLDRRETVALEAAGYLAGQMLLAEVAKDRAILALHTPYDDPDAPGMWHCNECEDPYPCQTVRLLAAIDADHEAYRPEWKPVAG